MQKRRKKRAVTLVEIMIVILLIGLIGGALAFNMRGSVDKGRVFKTEQNCARVYDALMMAAAAGDFDCEKEYRDSEKVKKIVKSCPFIKNPEKVLVDAWGEALKIDYVDEELKVYSDKAEAWETKHRIQ